MNLIELVIVVGLVAILSTIGYGSYEKHITQARRVEAQAVLLEMAAEMEKYYSQHFTYQDAKLSHSSISLKKQGLTEYTLAAIVEHDSDCKELLLKHTGEKLPYDCW